MDKKINNNGYDYVDLGLPTRTLWATCNIGASKPSDYGLYFQWGDTKGYSKEQVGEGKEFNWKDYKWNPSCDGKTFTKYASIGTSLNLEDDAAHVNMGGDWHMPRITQIKELLENTISTRIALDGVNGMKFTSKKDKSKFIFIPAAGYAWEGFVYGREDCGYVWFSMLRPNGVDCGQALGFGTGDAYLDSYSYRYVGRSIRGVIG